MPFTPDLGGADLPSRQSNGANWQRTGDTFETLTLSPSILVNANAPREYPDICHFHGFITNGAITFCGDSR